MKKLFEKGELGILKQGDIVWINFSPTEGHEQADYRPAVVISKELFNQRGLVILLPMTTAEKDLPFRVPVNLSKTGYVLVEQPRTFDLRNREYEFDEDEYLTKSELEEVLGQLKAIIF